LIFFMSVQHSKVNYHFVIDITHEIGSMKYFLSLFEIRRAVQRAGRRERDATVHRHQGFLY